MKKQLTPAELHDVAVAVDNLRNEIFIWSRFINGGSHSRDALSEVRINDSKNISYLYTAIQALLAMSGLSIDTVYDILGEES